MNSTIATKILALAMVFLLLGSAFALPDSREMARVGHQVHLRATDKSQDGIDRIERYILSHEGDFINATSASGLRGRANVSTPERRRAFVKMIEKYGLRSLLYTSGREMEKVGPHQVSESFIHPQFLPARLVLVVMPRCMFWTGLGEDWMAVGVIGSISAAPEVAAWIGAAGALMWMYGRYAC